MINKSKISQEKINFNVKYQNRIIPNTSNQRLVANYNTEIRRSREEIELPLPLQ